MDAYAAFTGSPGSSVDPPKAAFFFLCSMFTNSCNSNNESAKFTKFAVGLISGADEPVFQLFYQSTTDLMQFE